MTDKQNNLLFARKTLDEITQVPDEIISVYVVEQHIWEKQGVDEAKKARKAEKRTVEEFIIDPVRPFLNDIMRNIAAPYQPERRDQPVGQGYWIQAEFGSGKSHLLSFLGALALGDGETWEIIKQKEEKQEIGRRDSLYTFYENGLKQKNESGKGILVAVKTLVGYGGGAVGIDSDDKTSIGNYVLDAVADQFFKENGFSLPLYPAEILAKRFLENELEIYQGRLQGFLKDPKFFDDEQQQELGDFLQKLRQPDSPAMLRDCGRILWDFYAAQGIKPTIPMEMEDVLKNMVREVLNAGYQGILLILDEVSLYMMNRSAEKQAEDEKVLAVLSNRLAKVENLPIWTVCAAQQQHNLVGTINIFARERLDVVPLLKNQDDYYDIALKRVREITDLAAIDQYYEDYRKGFSWPDALGKDQFTRFFPFYKTGMEVMHAMTHRMTTLRSALYFMLETLKTQRKEKNREIISLWAMFDDLVKYEEDPSGSKQSVVSLKSRFGNEWQALELARHKLNSLTKGKFVVYRERCDKILRTLFLYHIAQMAPKGLSSEEIMNAVMEWRDHDEGQRSDKLDNKDHYELLLEDLSTEIAQVKRLEGNYIFQPATDLIRTPSDIFKEYRRAVADSPIEIQKAREDLLKLSDWKISSQSMIIDLARNIHSLFSGVAAETHQDIDLVWHGRQIAGRVFMKDLLRISKNDTPLPAINTASTNLDFHVFISQNECGGEIDRLVQRTDDPRVIFWTPDELTASEKELLIDFGAYRKMVADFQGSESEEAKECINWLREKIPAEMAKYVRVMRDSYGRGRAASKAHASLPLEMHGDLDAILLPMVSQVLDDVYISREMDFSARVPFEDSIAINVINGIVRTGNIPRNAQPTKEVSSAQDHGFVLQIMTEHDNHNLNLQQCRYTRDLQAWLEEKMPDAAVELPVDTVYKNFMGINGPGGLNYGLSRRMVQLYLLCLVREGKLRLSLSGKSAPVDVLDYTNLAEISFKVPILDSISRVQRLRPPQGWEVLAPFAALLMEDESLRDYTDDESARRGLRAAMDFMNAQRENITVLVEDVKAVFSVIGVEDSWLSDLERWNKFYQARIDPRDEMAYLRQALHDAFGYATMDQDSARDEDLADFMKRLDDLKKARLVDRHAADLQAAARFSTMQLPEADELADIRRNLQQAGAQLPSLVRLAGSEAELHAKLLAPFSQARESYRVRYLQLFDKAAGAAESVRQVVAGLENNESFRALETLAGIEALGADPLPGLRARWAALTNGERLFPAGLNRAEVERDLNLMPLPGGCPLTFENAQRWLDDAQEVLGECRCSLEEALAEKARLLINPVIRNRLEKGRDHTFVGALLLAGNESEAAAVLRDFLGSDLDKAGEAASALEKYLKQVRVARLSLRGFRPSQRTLEEQDVSRIAAEFTEFIQQPFSGQKDGEWLVVELED